MLNSMKGSRRSHVRRFENKGFQMSSHRRLLTVGLTLVAVVTFAGCTTKPIRAVNSDGTYCHRIGKSYRPKLTCTPAPVPTAAVEAEAKRFEADPASLTVFVLRRSWGDPSVALAIDVDGSARAYTIPDSLVRLRLSPTQHRLSMQWEGHKSDISVKGEAGQVQFVELVGSGWVWGTTFRWEATDSDSSKRRASASKLVADLDLRR